MRCVALAGDAPGRQPAGESAVGLKSMDELKLQSVKSNLLTYCAGFPQAIVGQGPSEIGKIAVALGNCFIWISGSLDGPGPQIEQPLQESAQSIFALGKQLRVAGLNLWDCKGAVEFDKGTQIALLRAEVARLDRLVHRALAERRAKC